MFTDYEALVASAGDAMVLSDAAGLVTVWNPAAERMFGFSAADALGQSLDLIIPEKQRKRHWDHYHKTMSTGQTRYGHELLRVPALHKDGRTLSISFTVGLVPGEDGKPAGVLACVRDETDRWAEERSLKRRVAELEANVQVVPTP